MGGGGLLGQNKYQPKYLREDNKAFKDLTEKTTDNGWITFKKEAKLNPNNFFKDYSQSLGLGKDYNFKPIKDETDDKKLRHQRFQLYYKNIPVEGAEFSLHSESGILTIGHGRVIDGLDIDISKLMNERSALAYALADKNLKIDDFKNKELPKGTLVLTKRQGAYSKENYRLAYWFSVVGRGLLDAPPPGLCPTALL